MAVANDSSSASPVVAYAQSDLRLHVERLPLDACVTVLAMYKAQVAAATHERAGREAALVVERARSGRPCEPMSARDILADNLAQLAPVPRKR